QPRRDQQSNAKEDARRDQDVGQPPGPAGRSHLATRRPRCFGNLSTLMFSQAGERLYPEVSRRLDLFAIGLERFEQVAKPFEPLVSLGMGTEVGFDLLVGLGVECLKQVADQIVVHSFTLRARKESCSTLPEA